MKNHCEESVGFSVKVECLDNQPITTRFSGSDVTGRHLPPVNSEVTEGAKTTRSNRLKFRLLQALLNLLTKASTRSKSMRQFYPTSLLILLPIVCLGCYLNI